MAGGVPGASGYQDRASRGEPLKLIDRLPVHVVGHSGQGLMRAGSEAAKVTGGGLWSIKSDCFGMNDFQRLLDFWWHLKVGEVIVSTRHVPRVDLFSGSNCAAR